MADLLGAGMPAVFYSFFVIFFNDTATTEIYTLSLHDALPISSSPTSSAAARRSASAPSWTTRAPRSEEHTSELQSLMHLVCRLLLEKKIIFIYAGRCSSSSRIGARLSAGRWFY